MKKRVLDPIYKKAFDAAYKLGVYHGESKSRKLLNCMRTTNSSLLELVRVLDDEYPEDGIVLNYSLAEDVVKAVYGTTSDHVLGQKIADIIETKKNEKAHRELKKLEQELIETLEKRIIRTKICSRCKKPKFVSEFYKNKYKPDGLRYACKDCEKEYKRKKHISK